MKQTHELKLDKEFWESVKCGDKTFEIRLNDRGFQKGDHVIFKKHGETYLGSGYLDKLGGKTHEDDAETMKFKITYVLSGERWGIKPDHVVFGIEEINQFY